MLAIVGANLIDGAGAPVIQNATVLVDGDRIIEAGPRASVNIPEGAEVRDATGHTIMPGLIDVHDHLASGGYGLTGRWGMDEPLSLSNIRTAQVIEDTLAAGYTTVRDAGGLDAGFKMAVEGGLIKGPRLIISVNIMTPTGGIEDKVSGSGHSKHVLGHDPLSPPGVADGIDGVRAKVRELVRCGADQIKFATTGGASGRPGNGPLDQAYALDEARALVDEAARDGPGHTVPRGGWYGPAHRHSGRGRLHRARLLPGRQPGLDQDDGRPGHLLHTNAGSLRFP